MISAVLLPLAPVGLALSVAAGVVLARSRAWRRGRAGARARLADLRQVPRRYLVDVHAIVARQPAAARMHAAAAGGLVLAALTGMAAMLGLTTGWIGAGLAGASGLLGLVGAGLVMARRIPVRPARLSGGLYYGLPLLLGVANLYFLAAGIATALGAPLDWTSPGGLALLFAGSLSLAGLGLWAGRGPMRHAFAGTLHLAWHPRPARFAGVRETALSPIDLTAPQLGARRVEDLEWRQLLGFDSCVQCGRCEEACPAFAGGLPLNPKRLVNDIARASAGLHYSGSPHPGMPSRGMAGAGILLGAGGAIASETIWACTTCRACVDACPMMIEHLDGLIALRRYATMEDGTTPGKAPELLDALHETDTQSSSDLAARLDFAADLDLPRIVPGRRVEVLLWIGEGGYELRNQRSLRAFIRLMRHAGVDFAVLPEERDCGDAARRLGDEIGFARLARANIETLARYSFGAIATLDPHAAHCLGREYAALGGTYQVFHHSTFLERLVREGRLILARRLEGRLTYHDPCYLGRYLGEIDAPRALIDRLGVGRVEMARHGLFSLCCGGGGGAPATDIKGERRIPELRMDQARACGAETVIVACPTCTIMLEGVTHPRPAVRELAEVLLDAVEGRAAQ